MQDTFRLQFYAVLVIAGGTISVRALLLFRM